MPARLPKSLSTRVQKHVSAFKHLVNAEDNEASDLARRFGLIYAGGRLGIDSGILSWKTSSLRDAISRSYHGALSLISNDQRLRDQGFTALSSFSETLPRSSELKKGDYAKQAGYAKRVNGCLRCRVKKQAFKHIFVSERQMNLVVNSLLETGSITSTTKIEGATRSPREQFNWPDNRRVRSLEIRLPISGDG